MAGQNPIAFNPETMTVGQVKECTETLSMMFDMINRGSSPEDVFHRLDGARAQMLRKWGAAK